jgi:GNAT superfamily N-acetyltransferase
MGDEIAVRIAKTEDADVLAQANIAMAWETERKRLDPATIAQGVRAVLNDPQRGFYVVAMKSGQIAGSLMVTFEWSDWRSGLIWWIQSVYVQPAFRRQDVFRKLFEFVETQASGKPDVCGIRLYVEQSNRVAKQAYADAGMQETSYRIYEKMHCRARNGELNTNADTVIPPKAGTRRPAK